MKREDKIKKLNELGIYGKWYNNVNNDEIPDSYDELLEDGSSWYDFISSSFIWGNTAEGILYWGDIAINK